MRKIFVVVLMVVLVPFATNAATIYFNKVTTYTDGAAIPTAKVPTIVYQSYTGPSATGPWSSGAAVTDNVAIPAIEPPVGGTLWYTVEAVLDGMTSAKAGAKSKSLPFPTPAGPVLRDVN